MPTIKDRLLIGIADQGRVKRARDLQLPVGSDEHNIIHVLYALNKQGLIAFRLDKRGSTQEPQRIKLTPRGAEYVAQLRRNP